MALFSNIFNIWGGSKFPETMISKHDGRIINIEELSPYIGKWVIKGRVISKSPVREYTNAKGCGKLFSFVLADKTEEVKVTAFNTDCERFQPQIECNKVYYILGRAQIKYADKRYTTADFEVTLNQDSLVEEVTDSAAVNDIPLAKFNFVSIGQLSDQQPAQPVDLIGALVSVSDVSSVMSRTKNKELKKREVVIVDMSRHTISVTIWGETGESFNGLVGDVFVTKGARVGTFGGKSASAGDCVFVNPDIPEVRKIKNWYSNLVDQNFTNLTRNLNASSRGGVSSDNWKCLSQLNDLRKMKILAPSGQSVFSRVKAMLMSVGRSPVYKCCPTEGCGKKLVDTQSGDMECQKCAQVFTQAKYRYRVNVEFEDRSGSSWVTLWGEKADNLFGVRAEDLGRYMEMDNKAIYEALITKLHFKQFELILMSNIEANNIEERVKHTVYKIKPLDPVDHTKQLLKEIRTLSS